jgi:hypothetical protein
MKVIAMAISAALVALTLALGVALTSGTGASAEPTCAGVFGSDLQVHGQHIVGDYVTGVGGLSGELSWPPAGEVGTAVHANGGAVLPGGPGPAFHFPNGAPPGASFCLEQAHPNGFEIPGPHDD